MESMDYITKMDHSRQWFTYFPRPDCSENEMIEKTTDGLKLQLIERFALFVQLNIIENSTKNDSYCTQGFVKLSTNVMIWVAVAQPKCRRWKITCEVSLLWADMTSIKALSPH